MVCVSITRFQQVYRWLFSAACFARASVEAVRAWRFQPPALSGAPALRTRWLFRFPAKPTATF
jgi:hypothetical protein